MDEREKLEQRERHERARRKHIRTREEEKAILEAARARKSERQRKKPRRRVDARSAMGDEEAGPAFEKIRRAARVRAGGAPALPPQTTAGDPSPGPTPTPASAHAVLVVAVHRDRVRVRAADGAESDLPLVGGAGRRGAARIAVGDRAQLSAPAGGGPAQLVAEPRRSVLSRPDPADPRRERVLAANVDQALIVGAARRPDFRPGLVERMLLALARGKVLPRVCINKADLLEHEPERAALLEQCAPWRARGIGVHLVSVESGEGLGALRAAIASSTCVLVGHSGVGKSSLLNALCDESLRATGDVRRGDGKGRHTTSASALVELADGTRIIDTPGIRSFGLWEVGRPELDAAFPEIAARAAECRFSDCTHGREPGCAVRAALETGELAEVRLRSYLSLRAEVGR